MQALPDIWQPLLLGGLLCGLVAGLFGFVAVRLFWRWQISRQLRARQLRRGRNTPSAN
jgi:uncharacterized protein (DUF2062 family)